MCCFVSLFQMIIVFTTGFTQNMVYTWWGGDMLSVWNDEDNLIVINVGILLSFRVWMVWFRCNIHFVTFGTLL